MLRFESVSYTYPGGAAPAVRGVSFSVEPGQAVLCTGRSGCGKSTLVKLACGLIPHASGGSLEGTVRVEGTDTRVSTPADLALHAGTLFQDPERQFFALTVKDEIALSLQWRGEKAAEVRRRVEESAEIMGVSHIMDRILFGLSEGQKQRAAMAALLAAGPRLLVLDEPTANLDPEAAADLAATIQRLKERGFAFFIVDHRLSAFAEVADTVLVMKGGEIFERGPFGLLHDSALRERYGLRAAQVEDARKTLPESPAETTENFVDCRNVTFAYSKGVPLLRGFSRGFAPGAITALVGENGVGKTTLARLLCGLEKPQTGDILVRGRSVRPKHLPRHVQVVLQNAGHQLRMNSVRAELTDAARLALSALSIPPAVEEYLSLFSLSALAGRHPQSLSGGEKQRLAVACALIRKPEMIILDEPTSGLDGENMTRTADVMRKAASEGAGVLVITHDAELLRNACSAKLTLNPPAKE